MKLAPWLVSNRDRVFLATKTGDRTGSGARASLERSLERMGVDHVDLIALHNLVDEEGWRTAMSQGGALAALVQARDEGLTRFIGVTGHGTYAPAMHLNFRLNPPAISANPSKHAAANWVAAPRHGIPVLRWHPAWA